MCFLNFSFCNSVFLMCLCSSLAGSRWRVRMDIISRNLVCTKGRKEFVNTNSYQDSLSGLPAIAPDSMRGVTQMLLVKLQQCRWAYYYF